MTWTRAMVVAAAAALLACPPQNTPKPVPPAPGLVPAYEPPTETATPGAGAGGGGGSAKRPSGARCDSGSQCASGVCEGPGCGRGLGVCAAAQRACTYDLQAYCGCDGLTFQASGTCPARRFSHRGACKVVPGGSSPGP